MPHPPEEAAGDRPAETHRLTSDPPVVIRHPCGLSPPAPTAPQPPAASVPHPGDTVHDHDPARGPIGGTADPSTSDLQEARLFVQEQMTGFVTQYGVTVLEAGLVVAKYVRQLHERLARVAADHGETLPRLMTERWPLKPTVTAAAAAAAAIGSPPPPDHDGALPDIPEAVLRVLTLDRLLELVDEQRMDIFDTFVRAASTQVELPLAELLLLLRQWEWLIRTRLQAVSHPRHLLTPLELPVDF